jgi:Glycine cleavage system T protein (aminomethyltransferase)
MKKFEISKNRRVRVTPYTSRLEKYGVGGYTVYNHMLLPTHFKSLEEEYFHLKKDVQLWDVSVQKQIEVTGTDSYKLVQLMTCRDLSSAKILKCYYVPLIDGNGNMINDPLILKVEDMKWRICIADSDVLLYAKGIADSMKLRVKIHETNISTLAVQGPKSFELMSKVFGEDISKLKFFNFNYYKFGGVDFMISKSGFSKQGGYEIYIQDTASGHKLYDYIIKIGGEFNLKPGCPNAIERIEGALLSYGNDMDNNDNPFECGLDKYINLESNIEFLGKKALQKSKSEGN